MAFAMAKSLTKLGVCGGALYYTLDQGVWSSSNQGSYALDKVRTHVLPSANEYFSKLPDADGLNSQVKRTWNSGVETAFVYIAASPTLAVEYSKKAVDEFKKQLHS